MRCEFAACLILIKRRKAGYHHQWSNKDYVFYHSKKVWPPDICVSDVAACRMGGDGNRGGGEPGIVVGRIARRAVRHLSVA